MVEGMSIRAISRLTGASKNTTVKLLTDAGKACSAYQDQALQICPASGSRSAGIRSKGDPMAAGRYQLRTPRIATQCGPGSPSLCHVEKRLASFRCRSTGHHRLSLAFVVPWARARSGAGWSWLGCGRRRRCAAIETA